MLDDTSLLNIYFEPRLACLKIDIYFRKISDWGEFWKVIFNHCKTKYIVFSHQQSYPDYPDVVFN